MARVSRVPGFNADQEAQRRGSVPYTIGGRDFNIRKRSVNLMREWYEAAPEMGQDDEEQEELAKENPLIVFESVVRQLNVLLRDGEGNEPGIEFLDEELDIEDGFIILGRCTPDPNAEEARAGNSAEAAA